MPTKEEFEELIDNTTHTWTTQNGVYGCLFTGSNDNSIFMPAAGYYDGTTHYVEGGGGRYWSSSLKTDETNRAWGCGFTSTECAMFANYRYYGRPIRAVRPAH